MRRLHLFEITDQAWCPAVVRDSMTDYLRFVERQADAYGPIAGRLRSALNLTGANQVVDLGSGAGGPWVSLYPKVAAEVDGLTVTLTDFHPNVAQGEAFRTGGNGITYHPEPVDATAVPAGLIGFRTLFSAFHHFRPERAREIIADAVRNGQGIGVFEVTERTLLQFLAMLVVPVVVLLVTPLIRPIRLSRLLLTYLPPVVPLAIGWDGFVSCWRTYTTGELRAMAESVPGADGYVWEIGQEPGPGMLRVTYLIGYPKPNGQTA